MGEPTVTQQYSQYGSKDSGDVPVENEITALERFATGVIDAVRLRKNVALFDEVTAAGRRLCLRHRLLVIRHTCFFQ
jgi:hypothetical protein